MYNNITIPSRPFFSCGIATEMGTTIILLSPQLHSSLNNNNKKILLKNNTNHKYTNIDILCTPWWPELLFHNKK